MPFNVAGKASLPKITHKEVNYFQPEDIADIRSALEDEPIKWRTLTHMLLITGARRGEMLRLGEYYRRQGFVFSQDNGAPMHPDSVSISKRLGHAQVSTTANIYAHVMEAADKKTPTFWPTFFSKRLEFLARVELKLNYSAAVNFEKPEKVHEIRKNRPKTGGFMERKSYIDRISSYGCKRKGAVAHGHPRLQIKGGRLQSKLLSQDIRISP